MTEENSFGRNKKKEEDVVFSLNKQQKYQG